MYSRKIPTVMTKFNAAFILLGLSHFPRWDIVDLPTCASCQNVEAFEARIKLFCILSLRALDNTLIAFSSISVTWNRKVSDTMNVTLVKVSTINPVFTFVYLV